MKPKENFTTTNTLPDAIRDKYELETLEGGPKFALPHYGQPSVDFSTIEVDTCEALIKAGFPHLKRRADKPTKANKE